MHEGQQVERRLATANVGKSNRKCVSFVSCEMTPLNEETDDTQHFSTVPVARVLHQRPLFEKQETEKIECKKSKNRSCQFQPHFSRTVGDSLQSGIIH